MERRDGLAKGLVNSGFPVIDGLARGLVNSEFTVIEFWISFYLWFWLAMIEATLV